jgi:hypothetical protein
MEIDVQLAVPDILQEAPEEKKPENVLFAYLAIVLIWLIWAKKMGLIPMWKVQDSPLPIF